MNIYELCKEDEYVFECMTTYENKSINYLLANREITQSNIEKCTKEKNFEMLAKFWKEEFVVNYLLKKKGHKEKRETDSLTRRIIEGQNELVDNFIRKAIEIVSKEKK